jgi:branched-chain amino acid transport system permease protein
VLVIAYVFGRVSVLPLVHASESAVMIATLAMSLIITNVALLLFGSDVTFIRSPFEETQYEIGSARISQQAIIALVAAPVVTALLLAFMNRTLMGTRIRATAQNPTLAGATGISTGSVYLIAVVIGVMLAALAGALYGPTTVVDVFGGDAMLLKAFTVAALAGMGKLWRAAIVGIAMGIAESTFSGYVTPAYAEAFIFGLLVVTLLFFPRGVFGGH